MAYMTNWFLSPQHRLLSTHDRLDPVVYQQLPTVRRLVGGRDTTFVRLNPTSHKILRALGHRVPSLEATYDYPGRFKPMDHQRKTVAFAIEYRRCFITNGMGTGKTAAALWAADLLMREGEISRVLVVSPKSTLHSVWMHELFQTLPQRRGVILAGDRGKKEALAKDPRYDFCIVNPESLHLVPKDAPFDLIIVDEFTYFKSSKAVRTKALAARSAKTRLWMMSGTPSPQNPTDAYAPITLVRGKFTTFRSFRDQTMTQLSQFKWVAKRNAAEVIHQYMQPCIRFSRDDCLDLPPCQIIDQKVEMTPAQEKMVKTFLKEAYAELDGATITATNAAAALSKALQVMSGGVYGAENGEGKPAFAVDSEPLFETIIELVNEAEGPVIVFAPFRISAAVIHARLVAAGLRSALVTGATTGEARSSIFAQVQSGMLDAMVAIPRTVSHGLTLTASNTIIWAGPVFSLETYEQANARINRQGQTRKTLVYRLTQNNLAKQLFLRLDSKAGLQQTLLELMERNDD